MNKVYTYRSGGAFWGLLLILVGVAILGDNLNWFSFDIWDLFWPAVIIIFGVNLLLRRNRRVVIQDTNAPTAAPPPPPPPAPSVGSGGNAAYSSGAMRDTDRLYESHAMGELDLIVESQAFRGGAVSTVFGDIRIDCSRAALADGEQHLALNTVFGEVRLFVPPSWEYSVEATTVFGEVEAAGARRGGIFSNVTSTTPNYATATRRLRVNASTVFGEVRVIAR